MFADLIRNIKNDCFDIVLSYYNPIPSTCGRLPGKKKYAYWGPNYQHIEYIQRLKQNANDILNDRILLNIINDISEIKISNLNLEKIVKLDIVKIICMISDSDPILRSIYYDSVYKWPIGGYGNSCACHDIELLSSEYDIYIISYLCNRTGHQLFSDDIEHFIIGNFKTSKEFILFSKLLPCNIVNFLNCDKFSNEYRKINRIHKYKNMYFNDPFNMVGIQYWPGLNNLPKCIVNEKYYKILNV